LNSFKLKNVESEGFEPSSKRRVFKLSTCLFPDWFSTEERTGTPKSSAYVLKSYKRLKQSRLPAQKDELPKIRTNGQSPEESTCLTYYTSERLSQFTFSKLSSKCVWRIVNYCSLQDIIEVHNNPLHADTWLPLSLSNPKTTPKNLYKDTTI